MDHYRKKETRKGGGKAEEDEIRVSTHGRVRVLVLRALGKLQKDGLKSIVLKGEAHTCTKAITVAEIVKRRMPTLYQNSRLLYSEVEEIWTPKDETVGLEDLQVVRKVPSIQIVLSLDALDPAANGYQAPLTQKKKPKKKKSRQSNSACT
eukprot:m.24548 g.24548  ORF g.24548 m.24548 type:complete len:150 (+) comp28639_c0_seq3:31-480(+)